MLTMMHSINIIITGLENSKLMIKEVWKDSLGV